jgi:hypothetical protein
MYVYRYATDEEARNDTPKAWAAAYVVKDDSHRTLAGPYWDRGMAERRLNELELESLPDIFEDM